MLIKYLNTLHVKFLKIVLVAYTSGLAKLIQSFLQGQKIQMALRPSKLYTNRVAQSQQRDYKAHLKDHLLCHFSRYSFSQRLPADVAEDSN